jgi:hypothetical protein
MKPAFQRGSLRSAINLDISRAAAHTDNLNFPAVVIRAVTGKRGCIDRAAGAATQQI